MIGRFLDRFWRSTHLDNPFSMFTHLGWFGGIIWFSTGLPYAMHVNLQEGLLYALIPLTLLCIGMLGAGSEFKYRYHSLAKDIFLGDESKYREGYEMRAVLTDIVQLEPIKRSESNQNTKDALALAEKALELARARRRLAEEKTTLKRYANTAGEAKLVGTTQEQMDEITYEIASITNELKDIYRFVRDSRGYRRVRNYSSSASAKASRDDLASAKEERAYLRRGFIEIDHRAQGDKLK